MSKQASNATSMSPRKSLTYTPKRNFVLRTPTSKLAYTCTNASDLISPTIPIILPKELSVDCSPETDALCLDALPSFEDNNADGDNATFLASTVARSKGYFQESLLLLSQDLSPPSIPSSIGDSEQQSAPCLKEILYQTIPADLWALVSSTAIINYSEDTETLRVTIGGMEPPSPEEMNCEFGSWKDDTKVSSLELVVTDSADLFHVFAAKPYKAVLWLLHWFEAVYGDTIQSISLNFPMSLHVSSRPNVEALISAIALDNGSVRSSEVYPKLKSLQWTGDARLLRPLVPTVASRSIEQLTVISDITTYGAQWLLKYLTTSKLHTLELRSLSLDFHPRSHPSFVLPHLETLRIGTAFPLNPLMAQIQMPRLRSVSLVLDSEYSSKHGGYEPLSLLFAFFADPNVGSKRLVFVDVQCGIEPEKLDHVEGLIAQHVSPDAVIVVC
ncbi:hypothetical protein JR316_0005239 [Psilocybe cubensis]|uniref:Uncharacterized protein n=2 Tax=Psilocybe cubensis TaxID=181762 RepID=A0ACB8H660_PSICU|nr:hypothetical protein JR316_0005239 [Psilocybe cubensis]KAH9483137.1 hypothetical protein JR316_0005239 [Psilocybe cubensis]